MAHQSALLWVRDYSKICSIDDQMAVSAVL